ncbi:MAG: penicillin-binding protein 1C [Deltaproteobacteria bacterium]|nr:penicillin-binding protein 1C [Deltaproteobacteria bacterium]
MSALRKKLIGCALAAGAAVGAVAGALEVVVRWETFDATELQHTFEDSVRIRDKDGDLLREVVNASGARAQWTALDEISPLVVEATLAVEDARFHQHAGVDWRSVVRAVAQNLRAGQVVSGASTLTMQLSRLVHPHPRRTLLGKLDEAVDALRMERVVSKHEILEQYLNRAPYGFGAIGVEAASLRYFGKRSNLLSLSEAALLAGLPKAPTALNPRRALEAASARRNVVLHRMLQTGKIDSSAYDRARREPVQLVAVIDEPSAMHFTDYLLSQAPKGHDIVSTLDGALQRDLESMVRAHVQTMSERGVRNAAVVVLDNRRCEIRAMVGSAGYWAGEDGSVNGAIAKRQPGSTLKPFTYALAFERGFSPASVVADVETTYGEALSEVFVPRNYSGAYSGPVLMGEALARSLNVPAIRVAQEVGTASLLERLRALGFASLDRRAEYYGLGLTLGNGEVTLLELAQAYATLARRGRGCSAEAIVDRAQSDGPPVFSEATSFMVSDLLADESLRIKAFGPRNALMVGFPVSIKTGTSSNWRDNWAIGYTDRYTVAVWTGDFSGRPLQQLAGATGAGPLFARAIHRVVDEPPTRLPTPPDALVRAEVCAMSGRRATHLCPTVRAALIPKSKRPEASCPWHREVRVDRRNGLLASEKCPKAFVQRRVFARLPPVYARWQAEAAPESAPPTRYSPHCPKDGKVKNAVVITHPKTDEVFLLEPGYAASTQSVALEAEVDPPAASLRWLIDGREVAAAEWPYGAYWTLERGRHALVAVAGTSSSEPVEIEVR